MTGCFFRYETRFCNPWLSDRACYSITFRLSFYPFLRRTSERVFRVQVSPSELEATLGQAVHVTVDASPLVGF
jgi:hypothetical protein